MSLSTAFSAFFKIAFNKDAANLWQEASQGKLISAAEMKKNEQKADSLNEKLRNSEKEIDQLNSRIKELLAAAEKSSTGEEAVYALTLLQREGRFVDFLMENISGFDDSQVGAAARQIHEGCKKTLDKYFAIAPIAALPEGETIEIPKNFDPSEYALSGRVVGEPPYKGEVKHKGWKVTKVSLPNRQKSHNSNVVNPAEIEIS